MTSGSRTPTPTALPSTAAQHARPRALRRSLAAARALIILFALALPTLIAGAQSAHAAPLRPTDRAPGGNFSNPVVRAVDIAEPAIVRMATLYKATVTLSICGVSVTVPSGGQQYTIGGLGSGAFISANGDVLTADHVVDIDKDSLDQEIFAGSTSSTDIATAIDQHGGCAQVPFSVTAADVQNGIVQYLGIRYTTSYSPPQRLVWQSSAFSSVISGSKDSQSILRPLLSAPHAEATLLNSSAFAENDLAVLHVDMADTPSIQLDNSALVAVQDQLTIVGFPGNGDVNGDPTNLLTPSVNSVYVSAIKTNDNGAQLIQVGGNVEHGDSGGPALDAAGRIVGVVSFGGVDSPDGTSFMRSSNSALTLINGTSVSTRPGSFETAWEQAFNDYASSSPGHWRTAARELDALLAKYPTFTAAKAYQQYADRAAQTEAPSTQSPLSTSLNVYIIGAVALLVLLVLLILLIALLSRRNRPQPAYATVNPAAPYQPYAPSGATYPGYPTYPGNQPQNYGQPPIGYQPMSPATPTYPTPSVADQSPYPTFDPATAGRMPDASSAWQNSPAVADAPAPWRGSSTTVGVADAPAPTPSQPPYPYAAPAPNPTAAPTTPLRPPTSDSYTPPVPPTGGGFSASPFSPRQPEHPDHY